MNYFVSQHFTKYIFVIKKKKKKTEQYYTCMCQNLKKYYYIVWNHPSMKTENSFDFECVESFCLRTQHNTMQKFQLSNVLNSESTGFFLRQNSCIDKCLKYYVRNIIAWGRCTWYSLLIWINAEQKKLCARK